MTWKLTSPPPPFSLVAPPPNVTREAWISEWEGRLCFNDHKSPMELEEAGQQVLQRK